MNALQIAEELLIEAHDEIFRLKAERTELLKALESLYRIVGTRCSADDAEAMLAQGDALKVLAKTEP